MTSMNDAGAVIGRSAPGGPTQLRRELAAHHLFALSFGTIVGTGWITGLGIWLGIAGSFGSMIGFALGGVVMMLIALCYAQLAIRYPQAGGAIAFTYHLWGVDAAFISGWCMVLVYVTAISFQTVTITWMLEALVSPAIRGPALYSIFGEPVYAMGVAVALVVGLGLAWLNYRGVGGMARFQSWFTFGKIAIAVVFFACALPAGNLEYLEPYWKSSEQGFAMAGVWAVFATAPFFLAGFDVVPLAMGEARESTSRRAVYIAIVGSLVAAVAYYSLVILCGALLLPRSELLSATLPTVAAFERAFDSPALARVVLAAGLMGVLTCWNSSVFAAGRILYAMGESRMIPTWFGHLQPKFATPARAIVFATMLGLMLLPFGKAVVYSIVNASGSSMALVALIVSMGLLRQRWRARQSLAMPLAATAGAAFVVVMALRESWGSTRVAGLPVEWLIFIVWIALGALFWGCTRSSRNAISEEERRVRLLGSVAGT